MALDVQIWDEAQGRLYMGVRGGSCKGQLQPQVKGQTLHLYEPRKLDDHLVWMRAKPMWCRGTWRLGWRRGPKGWREEVGEKPGSKSGIL